MISSFDDRARLSPFTEDAHNANMERPFVELTKMAQVSFLVGQLPRHAHPMVRESLPAASGLRDLTEQLQQPSGWTHRSSPRSATPPLPLLLIDETNGSGWRPR
jgi:hypothetical protein